MIANLLMDGGKCTATALLFADLMKSIYYLLPLYWLCQVEIHPGLNGLMQILLQGMSGQCDDRGVNLVVRFFLADALCRFVAIHQRHLK